MENKTRRGRIYKRSASIKDKVKEKIPAQFGYVLEEKMTKGVQEAWNSKKREQED